MPAAGLAQLDGKAGVKKDVEKLNRDLGRTTVPGRSEQVSPEAPTPTIPDAPATDSNVEPAAVDETTTTTTPGDPAPETPSSPAEADD